MPIVTFHGRIGSPVRALGIEVAHLLGVDYVDYRILAEAARRSGASMERISQQDERAIRGRERLGRFLQNFLEKSAAAGSAGDPFLGPTGAEVLLSRTMAEAAQPAATRTQELDDKRYVDMITSVIRDVAHAGDVVIIGRGSQAILKEVPNALHVYVVSSEGARLRTLVRRDGMTPGAAEKYLKDNEPLRLQYYKKLFKVNPEDPCLYHLFINVDKLGIEHGARMLAEAAREMDRQLAAA